MRRIVLSLALSGCSMAHVADDAGVRADAPPVDAPPSIDAGSDASPPLDAGSDAPLALDAGPCPTGDGTISDEFLALHETLIRPGCVGPGRFCHEGAYEGFGMLTPELAIENLVNVTGCAETRVVPCRPDESYALTVPRTGGDVCGRTFPSGFPGGHPTFTEPELAPLEAWIRNGAR